MTTGEARFLVLVIARGAVFAATLLWCPGGLTHRMKKVVLIALLLLAAGSACAAGDAEAGHKLAQLWCTSCHIVDNSPQGADTAPPFPTIAQRHHDRSWIRAWITAPHPPMPNFNLSRQQIDDIVAYLDTFAPK
jgi:mono/diheme cytochrome c family protein